MLSTILLHPKSSKVVKTTYTHQRTPISPVYNYIFLYGME